MRPPNNLEKKIPLETCYTVQLECKKVQAHCSLEQSLEYNQDQPFFEKFAVGYQFGSYRNIVQFQISSQSHQD